jgi:SAM-dependent methyltransferase
MPAYDPEQYWDAKARASAHDPLGAVCVGDPLRDRCIDRLQRRLMKLALRHIDRGAMPARPELLDMGCGTGRWADILRPEGIDYHGIDISSSMIEIARREHPSDSFGKFDGLAIPFEDGRFDIVMSLAVLHHNAYPRQETLLDDLVRVLKPGGTLILFEGVGRRTAIDDADAVFHYRPVADWQAAFNARGLALQWQTGARYFALESIAAAAVARLLRRSPQASTGPVFSRQLLQLGAYVDPWLISSPPARFHDRAMSVFRRL